MVGLKNEGEKQPTLEEIRNEIKKQLDTPGGNFAYDENQRLCIRRPITDDSSVLLPIDLNKGEVDDPSRIIPLKLKPQVLQALRDEVGWEAPNQKKSD